MKRDYIAVDELPLPKYLVELINQNRWGQPIDANQLKHLVNYSGNTKFDFLAPENMIRANQLTDLIDNPETAYRFGHASSQKSGHAITDQTILDVDLAVIIAMNWDEEAICLDYRTDLNNPTIVFSHWTETRTVWQTVAVNIEEFANALGL